VLADVEAQTVVGEALRLLGAERPTWEEGQRAYSGGADYCAWCSVEIPDDMRNQKGGYSYCSELCATRARLFNEDDYSDQKDRIGDQAYRVVRKPRSTSIICNGCGQPFCPDPSTRNPNIARTAAIPTTSAFCPSEPASSAAKVSARGAWRRMRCSAAMSAIWRSPMEASHSPLRILRQGLLAASTAERFCSEIHAVRAATISYRDMGDDRVPIAAELSSIFQSTSYR
jgi:hypothetical protein